jgi:DNA ligase-associated metallophosphoesterase
LTAVPAPRVYDFFNRGDGSLLTYVAGAEVVMRPSGALWLERDGVLVLADVHFEKGSSYAARGQLLPPYDTREALRRMALEVAALQPRAVVMLGDAFHDCDASDRLCREDAEALTAIVSGRTLVWVVGNHDPLPPKALPGEPAKEVAVAGLILRHEPTFGSAMGEAAGHLHPCARVSAGGRSVRRRCFVTDGDRLVLPAFGAYAGGLSVLDRAFTSLFHRPPLVVALGARRAHAVGFASVVGE